VLLRIFFTFLHSLSPRFLFLFFSHRMAHKIPHERDGYQNLSTTYHWRGALFFSPCQKFSGLLIHQHTKRYTPLAPSVYVPLFPILLISSICRYNFFLFFSAKPYTSPSICYDYDTYVKIILSLRS